MEGEMEEIGIGVRLAAPITLYYVVAGYGSNVLRRYHMLGLRPKQLYKDVGKTRQRARCLWWASAESCQSLSLLARRETSYASELVCMAYEPTLSLVTGMYSSIQIPDHLPRKCNHKRYAIRCPTMLSLLIIIVVFVITIILPNNLLNNQIPTPPNPFPNRASLLQLKHLPRHRRHEPELELMLIHLRL